MLINHLSDQEYSTQPAQRKPQLKAEMMEVTEVHKAHLQLQPQLQRCLRRAAVPKSERLKPAKLLSVAFC